MAHAPIEQPDDPELLLCWQADSSGRLTYLSAGAESAFGRSRADLLGRTLIELSAAGQDEGLRLSLSRGVSFHARAFASRRANGVLRQFRIDGVAVRSADSALLGYCGTFRADVGESETNVRLVEQNRRFNAALENMTQGLCMFDAQSRLLVWNRRYLDMFGLAPDDLHVGMRQSDIIGQLMTLGRYKAGATADSVSEGTRTSLRQDGRDVVLRELADGRVIAATHRPMEGGGWVATFDDITERRRNEARIAHMARHDALTDLPNRTALREIGTDLMSRDGSRSVAAFCLDLDRFKPVNDSYGHGVGDALLKAVAERLLAATPAGALVARLGGDEFAILAQVDLVAGALSLAQRLIAAITAPYDLTGLSVEIGMSVGVALGGDETLDIDRLLKNADMALYEAKRTGRGTYCLFEPSMDETLRERHQLERQLREALTRGDFELHYQPLVSFSDGASRISGVEALVRWRHPEQGLISPATFIPLAEETGLILPLGEWVLRQACQDAAFWPPSLALAVNVSPLQLRSRSFVQSVVTALAESGVEASRLELEITESVLLEDTEANLDTLHTLRELGVRISMDDFGTGYSSISYLRRFPFDKIKIDRSFVHDIGSCAEASAIIRAIIELGSSLGITTLVEGIETATQLDMVRAAGAQEIQGYLFSPPRPAAEITPLLETTAERREPERLRPKVIRRPEPVANTPIAWNANTSLTVKRAGQGR